MFLLANVDLSHSIGQQAGVIFQFALARKESLELSAKAMNVTAMGFHDVTEVAKLQVRRTTEKTAERHLYGQA